MTTDNDNAATDQIPLETTWLITSLAHKTSNSKACDHKISKKCETDDLKSVLDDNRELKKKVIQFQQMFQTRSLIPYIRDLLSNPIFSVIFFVLTFSS